MTKPTDSTPLRRSPRLHLQIPVSISGTFPDGSPFNEEAYLLDISKFGAKLRTQLPLGLGMQIKILSKKSTESALFRVVWTGDAETPRAGEVGIEYVAVSNFLGINFPG